MILLLKSTAGMYIPVFVLASEPMIFGLSSLTITDKENFKSIASRKFTTDINGEN